MKSRIIILLTVLLSANSLFAAPPVEEGKTIFSARCASCHNINKDLVGPALAGLHERRSIDWITNFIQSSQAMVKTGDKTAVELFEKFNKIPMPDHKDLTPDNIKNLVEYIKTESKTNVETAPFAKPSKIRPTYVPLSLSNPTFFLAFFALVGILIAALLFAVQIKEYERNMKHQN